MTDTATHNLALPFITAAQAQKHVTHNEAIRALDVMTQLAVQSRSDGNPPDMPENGDQFIIGPDAIGVWTGRGNDIAAFQDGAWVYYRPRAGWLCWVQNENSAYIWDGENWSPLQTDSELNQENPVERLGVNTQADNVNKLAVKSDAILFSHDDITPGNGDLRTVLNKSSADHTASLLLQNNFSSRAEIGLNGSDDLDINISSDGVNFQQSLHINHQDGHVSFPQGIRHKATGQKIASYLPSPVKEIWRLNQLRPASPRRYTLEQVDGTVLILAQPEARTIFSSGMRGNAMVRVWNTSKTPHESCWVNYDNSDSALNVSNSDHITGWAPNDVLQIGDPAGQPDSGLNVLGMAAIDISPYLFNELGAVFRQSAVTVVTRSQAVDGVGRIGLSATGAGGSAFDGYSLSDGSPSNASFTVPCSVKSPISDSNLIYVREVLSSDAAGHGTNFIRILGVWG